MPLKNWLLIIFIFCAQLSSAQYVVRVAGNDSFAYQGDGGPALNASMYTPYGVCRDGSGNLYFSDDHWGLDCCGFGRIRKVSATTGIITTIAGNDTSFSFRNNVPATSSLVFAFAVRANTAGDLYLAEGASMVRKIDHTTGIISMVAGINDTGYSGDGGPATLARITEVQDVALDAAGNLYIADGIKNVVRKVTAATGIITTVAGNGTTGFTGDGGPATAASFNQVNGVCVDNSDNIYIVDEYNLRVRMVSAATGIVNTIMGNGVDSATGNGGPATAAGTNDPKQVAVDDLGNVFISEGWTRIRKIDAITHIITAYAGTGAEPYRTTPTGDGGLAASAIVSPWGMCLDKCGDLYFADLIGEIRVVVPEITGDSTICSSFITNSVPQVPGAVYGIKVYPNPADGLFNVVFAPGITGPVTIIVTDLLGQTVKEQVADATSPVMIQLNAPPGVYFVSCITKQGKWTERILCR